MDTGRVNRPLVECPRVAKVCHPGDADAPRESPCGVPGFPRGHRGVDQIDTVGDGRARRRETLLEPPRERRAQVEEPPRTTAPTTCGRWLRLLDAQDLDVGRKLGAEGRISRGPFRCRPRGARDDDGLVSQLRQVLDELHRALNTRAPVRGEVVGEKENPSQGWAHSVCPCALGSGPDHRREPPGGRERA